MNKPAVSQAQIARTIKALANAGKTVGAIVNHPDGSIQFVLTDSTNPPLPSRTRTLSDWDEILQP